MMPSLLTGVLLMILPRLRHALCLCILTAFCAAAAAQTMLAHSAATLPDDPGFLMQQSSASAESGTGAVVQGTVTDGHGSLIPGAAITLEQKGSGRLHETTSDTAGRFVVKNLPPGAYTVLISAPAFKTYVSAAFEVLAGEHVELPDTALAVFSSSSVEVTADSTAVAEEELKREEEQRIVSIIPNFYTSFIYDAAPLNTRQKFKLATHSVLDPTAFLGVAISAGIEQANDTFPGWGNSDAASYGKRFAAGYGDDLLTRFFSYAIYPSVFHQDPRYFYLGPKNKLSTRFWHAALNGVLTRGDNGKTEINYSHMLGSASAGALSSVYHPASDSAGYLAGLDFAVGIGASGAQALIREFVWPHLTTHVPAYANGRTPQDASAKP